STSSVLPFRAAATGELGSGAARSADGTDRAGGRVQRPERGAGSGQPAERRRAPPAPARSARTAIRAADLAARPPAPTRGSVLRARVGARAQRGRRPVRPTPAPRDARRARA